MVVVKSRFAIKLFWLVENILWRLWRLDRMCDFEYNQLALLLKCRRLCMRWVTGWLVRWWAFLCMEMPFIVEEEWYVVCWVWSWIRCIEWFDEVCCWVWDLVLVLVGQISTEFWWEWCIRLESRSGRVLVLRCLVGVCRFAQRKIWSSRRGCRRQQTSVCMTWRLMLIYYYFFFFLCFLLIVGWWTYRWRIRSVLTWLWDYWLK